MSRAEVELYDLLPVADLLDFWLRSAEELLAPTRLEHQADFDPVFQPAQHAHLRRDPRGVVGVVSGDVRPVALPLRAVVPALLAGNAVVVQSSETSAASTALLQTAFAKLLPDADLLTFLVGPVEQLAESGVDAISFSGSLDDARALALACAQRLVPYRVELTGTSADAAALVLADAPFPRAVRGVADHAITGAPPWMARLRRVYVERAVSSAFLEGLRPLLEAAELPLRVSSNLLGLDELPDEASVVRVFVVSDAAAAVEAINQRSLALPVTSVSVWSKRPDKTRLRALRAASITLQTHGVPAPIDALATSLDSALEPFVQSCVVVESRSGRAAELGWAPRGEEADPLLRAAIVARGGGAGFWARLGALLSLFAGYLRRRLASD